VPPHVKHTNHLEIRQDGAEIAETVHPLKLKDLQHSIACEQAMDAQPQDEDVGKLEQLESRQNLLEICPRGNNKVVIIISLGL
jgi:hypothetical protein